jgi:hypothetical protein
VGQAWVGFLPANSAFQNLDGRQGRTDLRIMAKPLISDELWSVIDPLLPPERPKPKGGRPIIPPRAALSGILFVLRSGIPWEMLPREMGW